MTIVGLDLFLLLLLLPSITSHGEHRFLSFSPPFPSPTTYRVLAAPGAEKETEKSEGTVDTNSHAQRPGWRALRIFFLSLNSSPDLTLV